MARNLSCTRPRVISLNSRFPWRRSRVVGGTPVAPEASLEMLSEVRSNLPQQEGDGSEDESGRSSEWQLEAIWSKRREQ